MIKKPETLETSTPDLRADVLIIGGGLVGGTLAVALAGAGVSVICVDAAPPEAGLDVEFDGRASAIALASKRVLAGIGLWDAMAPSACPIEDIRVSDGDSLMFLHYDRNDIGAEAFGYMVENLAYRRALVPAMQATEGLTFLAPCRVARIARTPTSARVRLEDGRVLSGQIIIGCEGRNSLVRDHAGIRTTGWMYNQMGIVCTVQCEKSHQNIAHEHFLPAGPFAILPLNQDRASLVWTEHKDLAPGMVKLPEAQFLSELKSRFGDFLGELALVGPRWCYPLALQGAQRYVDHRLALAGDAAHGMHPIAGQGLNMGLRDVAALAEILVDRRRLGLDLGAADGLNRYQRWRRFDNSLMLALTDALNRLFSNDIEPIRLARDAGLATVDKLPPVKKFFMRHAMGLAGNLPRLMAGQNL